MSGCLIDASIVQANNRYRKVENNGARSAASPRGHGRTTTREITEDMSFVFSLGQLARRNGPINLLSIDHDGGLARKLELRLHQSFVVEDKQSLPSLVARMTKQNPQAAVVNLPDEEVSLNAIRHIRRTRPKIRLVTLGQESTRLVKACIEAGADTLLCHTTTREEIEETIEMLVAHAPKWTPEFTYQMFVYVSQLSTLLGQLKRCTLKLSGREMEVLELIEAGLTNDAIASRLCLSTHTIKNHVHNILKKLEVKNRHVAVEMALKRGWLR